MEAHFYNVFNSDNTYYTAIFYMSPQTHLDIKKTIDCYGLFVVLLFLPKQDGLLHTRTVPSVSACNLSRYDLLLFPPLLPQPRSCPDN